MPRPKVLVSTKDMPEEEWLQWRRKGIGGSDAPAVVGEDPYRSPMDLWLDKVGLVPPREAGEAAHWGHRLEAAVAEEWAERNGAKIRRRHAILQHPDLGFVLCNLDREIVSAPGRDGPGVLEVKTTSLRNAADWDDTKEPPARVVVQWQHAAAVAGYRWGAVAVLIGGQIYRQWTFEADREFQRSILSMEQTFWGYVEGETPPPPDGHPKTAQAMARYKGAEPGTAVVLGPEAMEAARAYKRAAEAVKRFEAAKDEAGNRLRSLLGAAEVAMVGDVQVATWKAHDQSGFDQARFEAEHPDLFEQYSRSRPVRRLLIGRGVSA